MNKRAKTKIVIKTLACLIFISISILFLYISIFFDQNILDYPNFVNKLIVLPILVVFVLFFSLYNKCFDFDEQRFYQQFYSVLVTITLTTVFTLVLPYFSIEYKISKKVLLLSFIIEIIVMTLWLYISRKIYFKILKPLRTILISDLNEESWIIKQINLNSDKYHINEVISSEQVNLDRIIDDYTVVLIGTIVQNKRSSIIKKCIDLNKQVLVRPFATDIMIMKAGVEQIDDLMLISTKKFGMSVRKRILKRIMDIILSFLGIILTSPIMAICAALIYLEDKKNPLYKQERLTRANKKFYVYKLRTMIMNAEDNGIPILATINDARITKLGGILRKTRIDELPQLFNVLFGDMSMVGPRPERSYYYERINSELPEFKYRLTVKAGLTGYAQVWGRYNTNLREKLMMDLMYIQDYSFILDIKLVFETLRIIFNKRAANGVAEEELVKKYSLDKGKRYG